MKTIGVLTPSGAVDEKALAGGIASAIEKSWGTRPEVNEIPENSPAIGDIAMSFSANAFGLTNAATPIGIKAMEELQKHNTDKTSASNAMCMFLAMNTAGFQLVPATVIAILIGIGYKNPTSIIAPTLLVTTISFISAIFLAKIFQKFWKAQSNTAPHQKTVNPEHGDLNTHKEGNN